MLAEALLLNGTGAHVADGVGTHPAHARAATLRRQLTAAELSRQLQARPTPDQLEERNILRQHLRSVSARLALRIEALKARMAGDAVARVVRERSR